MGNKRILFTGGGTAGHVIVNLALIPHFQKKGWKIDYIGSKNGIERDLIEGIDGVSYFAISTGKLRRYLSVENMKDPFKVMKGVWQAWRIIRKRKPHVIFSKGGFVSVPVVIAGKLARVPTLIHESDITPGLANKIASPFAKTVLTTFPETNEKLAKKKAMYVGAVIREELFQGDATRGYELTGLNKNKPILLIMGGSSGAKNINRVIRENITLLLEKYQVIHICGMDNVEHTMKQAGYVQFDYINEGLNDILAITDYVISRAGANAIFEFLALRIPMLLIPLPLSASRGDQIENAESFKKSGFAQVLYEENIAEHSIVDRMQRLESAAPIIRQDMERYESKHAREHVIKLIKQMSK